MLNHEKIKVAELLEAWADTERMLALRLPADKAQPHKSATLNYIYQAKTLRGAKDIPAGATK